MNEWTCPSSPLKNNGSTVQISIYWWHYRQYPHWRSHIWKVDPGGKGEFGVVVALLVGWKTNSLWSLKAPVTALLCCLHLEARASVSRGPRSSQVLTSSARTVGFLVKATESYPSWSSSCLPCPNIQQKAQFGYLRLTLIKVFYGHYYLCPATQWSCLSPHTSK